MKNEKRKKLKGRILSYILTSALIVGLMLNNVLTVSAEESAFVTNNLIYKILTEAEGENPGTVSVMGYETKPNGAVTIPDSIKHPDSSKQYSVTSIGDSAFEGYSDLTSVTIPSSVTSIGDSAFYDCSDLTSVEFDPDSQLTSIGDSAFNCCSGLTSVTIPSSVISIGYGGFNECSGLTRVDFGDNSQLTSIGDNAFYCCSGLTSIKIPDSVTSIGFAAFSGCSVLTSVEFGTNSQLTSIGDQAFLGCSGLTSVTIPDGVTSIGQLAFWNCIDLDSVTIPSSVTSIGDYAFLSCNLTTVNVPCTWNFETPLYNFGSVTPTVYHVGKKYTAVNNSIHDSCSCGEEVWSTATIRATGGTYNGSAYGASVSYSDDWTSGKLTIHYTKNGENSWTTDAPSNASSYNASITVGEGEDAVTASAVFEIARKELTVTEATATGRTYEKGNTSVAITGVVISGILNEDEVSVRTTDLTGTLSSANAGAYTEVTLPDLTLSGKDKDNYVVTQASKTVPTNVTISPQEMGTAQNVTKNYPFLQENADTVNLGSLLPEDCGTVVSYGTTDVSGDITYKVAPSIKEGTLTYTVAKGSEEIVGNKGTITIHVQTQNYTDVPVTISIVRVDCTDASAPEVGTEIASEDGSATYKVTEAGENGNSVTYEAPTDKNQATVVVPATVTINNITYNVTTISDTAFAGNKKLTSVTIGDNVTGFSDKTFKGCSNLKTLIIGNGVTSVPANAFKNFKKLTTVKMGTGVKTIGKNAFYGCKKLKNLTIGKNVVTLGDKAFYKCTSLTKLTIPSKVKTIGKSTFEGCKALKTITIGKSVTKIGSKAFYGCSKTKTLTIKSSKLTTKKIGSKAFTKTPKSMTVKVPKKKFDAYKTMLMKRGVNKKARFKKN